LLSSHIQEAGIINPKLSKQIFSKPPNTSLGKGTKQMRQICAPQRSHLQEKSVPCSSLHDNTNLDAAALDPLVLLPLWLLVLHLLLRLVLLLLPTTILHLRLLLLARIPTRPRHRVRRRMMRLPVLRMLRLMLLPIIEVRHLRRRTAMLSTAALAQIDINPALVLLGIVLQSQFPADGLDLGLDLLHVPDAVVSLADDDVQVPLPCLLGVADALFQDLFGFLDELAVQVDGVGVDAADGVVFAENVLGRLFVELVGFGGVGFALDGEVVGGAAVAALVGLLGACGEGLVLRLFVPGGVAQAVVFAFRVVGGGVVEGWSVVGLLTTTWTWLYCGWFGALTYHCLRGAWRGTLSLDRNECDSANG
jgi:hypothetical protein